MTLRHSENHRGLSGVFQPFAPTRVAELLDAAVAHQDMPVEPMHCAIPAEFCIRVQLHDSRRNSHAICRYVSVAAKNRLRQRFGSAHSRKIAKIRRRQSRPISGSLSRIRWTNQNLGRGHLIREAPDLCNVCVEADWGIGCYLPGKKVRVIRRKNSVTSADSSQTTNAFDSLSFSRRAGQCGKQDNHENPDDCQNDKQFEQRESAIISEAALHGVEKRCGARETHARGHSLVCSRKSAISAAPRYQKQCESRRLQ
jgi:hypothetical protein